ncbi:MAG TPA: sigma-70 family RNA polymerase sigma factor [Actinomycetes bacterium]|jgi:RNA polymerase sigma-70 factor (ECF subfamily)|nr:sigma-70 family RNA polymerase sigma factor [Actinomycetes bacterium]
MPADQEFASRTDPFRRELLAHCYRMLGSVHDAEDLVQETLLRAWRSYGDFDDRRASLRTWLYRIATNACLTALEQRARRALPSDLTAAGPVGEWPPREPLHEVAWLEPIPDALLEAPADPAAIVASRGSVRLALIAALQHLPARQRAVLILRDVLAWRAAEVAGLLGTSTASVNSALQRARAQLAEVTPVEEQIAEPDEAQQRELLDRYVAAFVNADAAGIASLLREDVELEMPPYLTWFAGRQAVLAFLARRFTDEPDRRRRRMVPTSANGQPTACAYLLGPDGVHHAHSIQVLTMAGSGIARIVAFLDTRLFRTFGLPLRLEAGVAPGR